MESSKLATMRYCIRVLAATLLLAGCAQAGKETEGADHAPIANAIDRGNGVYLVPVGIDKDGCERFTLRAPGRRTNQAIYFRQADGSFGIGRDDAACRVLMRSIGEDEEGCERYVAEPDLAGLTPSGITYYVEEDGRYTVNRSRAVCTGNP